MLGLNHNHNSCLSETWLTLSVGFLLTNTNPKGTCNEHMRDPMSSFNHQTSASNLPDAPRAHEPTTSYLTYPVAHVVSGLYRRLTDPSASTSSSRSQSRTSQSSHTNNNTGVYTPPHRTASPFQPPPLSPLILRGIQSTTSTSAQILSRSLAEEIRLLVPPRLQLVEDWTLAYSVEQDGVSLGTLYAKCDEYRGKRAGFVLVVRDGAGGV